MTTRDPEKESGDQGETGAASFSPVKAAPYWDVLEPVVVAAVSKAARMTGRDASGLYPVATAFVLWAWQSKGLELSVNRIFRRPLVSEFVHRGMGSYTRGSRATYRSKLFAIVDVLTPPADRPFPIPRSTPTAPYTPAEIASLRSWAHSQGSAARRKDAWVLLALGFGSGLATRELLSVRIGDVDLQGNSAYVMVWDGRPRVVPVLPAWEHAIRNATNGQDANGWLFRPGRQGVRAAQVTDFLHRGHTTELDVRPARMRTTWMLTHLQSGTPPQDLLRIAGLEHLAALDRLRRFLPPRAPNPPRA